ncbi:glycosyl hydrolase family 18 protein [Clostridium akagii]|uniref:glycosyl hydrolase family 18 protein n=1 Tax=Clostridium akagii TaxID=91623 RepID=UPI00047C72A8|nr:glycosyl hydrolase family 18 protein [Clostridium akagii]
MVNYVVKAGDSPWSIAKKYGVNYNDIVAINGLTNRKNLVIGESLLIPINQSKYREEIEVNGFIIPTTTARDKEIVDQNQKYLTLITPFSYHVNENGTLTDLRDDTIIKEAKKYNVSPMLCVANISSSGGFDTELIGRILNDKNIQNTLINNIINTLKRKGLGGVIVDFERIPPKDRQNYNDFLQELVRRVHAAGKYLVGTALAPKQSSVQTGPWYEAHDYEAHGKIVDFVILMTYEWGWSGGPPRAVAPINEVIKVLNYAVSVIPSYKIMMGVPYYGYDWKLPFVQGGPFAEALGNQEAVIRAEKYGANIKYDVISQSPFYNYMDENRVMRVVWFEDSRSMMAKFNLVIKYGLRGVSYWVLGKPFPQNWALLNSMFRVKKL